MTYEEAVIIWAEQQLEARRAWGTNDRYSSLDTVSRVDFELDEGYRCCGGRDPDCYCSLAESPSFQAHLHGEYKGKKNSITLNYIDFSDVLRELFEISQPEDDLQDQ